MTIIIIVVVVVILSQSFKVLCHIQEEEEESCMGRKDKEEDVSRYQMTLRKREDTGTQKNRKN